MSRGKDTSLSPAHSIQSYQRTRILTARREDLVLMLYDGALRFCEAARLGLVAGDREQASSLLERARRIVLYLVDCLRPEHAPELCALVGSAYLFVYRRLVEAALRSSVEALDEAVGVLNELRRTWAELISRSGAEPPQERPSPGRTDVRLTG